MNSYKEILNTFMTFSRQVNDTAASEPSTISDSVKLCWLTSDLVKNFSVVLVTIFMASSLCCQFYESKQRATFLPKTCSILLSITAPSYKVISLSSTLSRLMVEPSASSASSFYTIYLSNMSFISSSVLGAAIFLSSSAFT